MGQKHENRKKAPVQTLEDRQRSNTPKIRVQLHADQALRLVKAWKYGDEKREEFEQALIDVIAGQKGDLEDKKNTIRLVFQNGKMPFIPPGNVTVLFWNDGRATITGPKSELEKRPPKVIARVPAKAMIELKRLHLKDMLTRPWFEQQGLRTWDFDIVARAIEERAVPFIRDDEIRDLLFYGDGRVTFARPEYKPELKGATLTNGGNDHWHESI